MDVSEVVGATGTAGVVERVDVSAAARAQLPGADYGDAFRATAGGPHHAGRWARKAFEGGPPARRRVFAAVVWRGILGLRLAPEGAPGHVAGWAVAAETPGLLVMRVESWMLEARIVVEATDRDATVSTLLRFTRPPAAAVWAAVGAGHRALLPAVLGGTARSLARRGS